MKNISSDLDNDIDLINKVGESIEAHKKLLKELAGNNPSNSLNHPVNDNKPIDMGKVDDIIAEIRCTRIKNGLSLFIVFLLILMSMIFTFNGRNNETNSENKTCLCVVESDSTDKVEVLDSNAFVCCRCTTMNMPQGCDKSADVLRTCANVILIISFLIFVLIFIKIISRTIEKRTDMYNDIYRALYDLKIRGIRGNSIESTSRAGKNSHDCQTVMTALALILSLIALIASLTGRF